MNKYVVTLLLMFVIAVGNVLFWLLLIQNQQKSTAEEEIIPPNRIVRSSGLPTAAVNNANQAPTAPPVGVVSDPKKIVIPKIKLSTEVESIAMDSQGRMDVPKNFNNVGWYNLGYIPGEGGSAVVSGHFDNVSGKPAAFYNLSKLSIGDEIQVTNQQGQVLTFKVTEIQKYPYDKLPLDRIFLSAGHPQLNLITCGGIWNRSTRNYSERWVVYSSLIN